MLIEHDGERPTMAADVYVAPNAVLSGDVRLDAGARVLFGAVVTAEGGPVTIGAHSVVMEHAVVRGTGRHPAVIGRQVLVGPHAYVTGATLEDEVFVATNAMVFNGARLGRASSVALGAAVRVGGQVPAGTRIPIGWVAVGDPAQLHPPDDADAIRAGLDEAGGFFPSVFGTPPDLDRSETMQLAMRRYTTALGRHVDDQLLPDDIGALRP
jgi:carbonic anhydrase/acetyltransferase-like protein (isoleucine patch superfamily)